MAAGAFAGIAVRITGPFALKLTKNVVLMYLTLDAMSLTCDLGTYRHVSCGCYKGITTRATPSSFFPHSC